MEESEWDGDATQIPARSAADHEQWHGGNAPRHRTYTRRHSFSQCTVTHARCLCCVLCVLRQRGGSTVHSQTRPRAIERTGHEWDQQLAAAHTTSTTHTRPSSTSSLPPPPPPRLTFGRCAVCRVSRRVAWRLVVAGCSSWQLADETSRAELGDDECHFHSRTHTRMKRKEEKSSILDSW